MLRAILLSSLAVNVGVLLGRLAGFAREALVASSFGSTAQADVVVLMLTVPDLLINLLVGSGLTAALIPRFTQSPEHARALWAQSFFLFAGLFAALALVLSIQSTQVFSLFGPGVSAELLFQTRFELGIVLWLLPLTVLSGVLMAYLQADSRFVASSLGTLVINVFILAGLLIGFASDSPLTILAIAALLGGLARFLMQLWAAVRIRGLPDFSLSPWLIDKGLLSRFLQVVLAGGVLLSFPVVARAFASELGAGELAVLSYALKLVEFPQVLAVTFLGLVLFPRLSAAFTENPELYGRLAVIGLQLTVFLALCATVLMFFNAQTFARWVYGYGAMTDPALTELGQVLAFASMGLVLTGVSHFCMMVLNAQSRTLAVFVITLLGLALLLIGLNYQAPTSLADVVLSLLITQGLVASGLLGWTLRCLGLAVFLNLRWIGVVLGPALALFGVYGWVDVAGGPWEVFLGSLVLIVASTAIASATLYEARAWVVARLRP